MFRGNFLSESYPRENCPLYRTNLSQTHGKNWGKRQDLYINTNTLYEYRSSGVGVTLSSVRQYHLSSIRKQYINISLSTLLISCQVSITELLVPRLTFKLNSRALNSTVTCFCQVDIPSYWNLWLTVIYWS